MMPRYLRLLLCSAAVAGLSACSDVEFSDVNPVSGGKLSAEDLDDNDDGLLSDDEIDDNDNDDVAQNHNNNGRDNDDDKTCGNNNAPNLDDDMPGSIDDNFACGEANEKKVLICHVPHGNPDARHTLCIGRAALKAHFERHGVDGDHDTLGACQE